MSFELKQIITQIFAFLLMLWILKRYVWKPLLSLLDERTRTIQAQFQEIAKKNAEASLRKQEYEQKINAIENEGQQIIQKAVKESQKIASDIQIESQKKAHEVILKAQEQANREVIKAKTELRHEMINTSFVALEKIVRTKLSQQERDRFARELIDEV